MEESTTWQRAVDVIEVELRCSHDYRKAHPESTGADFDAFSDSEQGSAVVEVCARRLLADPQIGPRLYDAAVAMLVIMSVGAELLSGPSAGRCSIGGRSRLRSFARPYARSRPSASTKPTAWPPRSSRLSPTATAAIASFRSSSCSSTRSWPRRGSALPKTRAPMSPRRRLLPTASRSSSTPTAGVWTSASRWRHS